MLLNIFTSNLQGLIPAVQQVFPEAEHRFCVSVRHLYQNFRVHFKGEILKNQLWACAKSSSIRSWNMNMEKMKELNQDAYEWLEKIPPNTWVRAFFSTFPKCDILLNNSCEVLNKYILEAKELPILIHVHAARGTTARPEARQFGPARAQPGPVMCGPGLARPDVAGRAWADSRACGLARHDPSF